MDKILKDDILEVKTEEFLEITIGLIEVGVGIEIINIPVILAKSKEVGVGHGQIQGQVVEKE